MSCEMPLLHDSRRYLVAARTVRTMNDHGDQDGAF